jgi:multidrug efflux system outer membrane protein
MIPIRRIQIALCLIPVLGLAACKVGPNYSRPSVHASAGWKERAGATNAGRLPTNWWTLFNDSALDSLEAQAIRANQDLKRAVARVTEARALARASAADFYPNVSGSGGYSRNRFSANRQGAPQHDLEGNDFSGQFDLSYELDVWGRVRRTVEAARADAAAVGSDMQVVLLTLTSDVARNYYLLRSLDREREVSQATIDLRRDTVRLQETRNQAGLINEVDVTRARTELANVEADLSAINRRRAQIEHALAILCGRAPAEFVIPPTTEQLAAPEIPPGLPASLLERRPDIVEAEQLLRASSARIGVAKAAFFPTIKLTSVAGFASADLSTALNWQSQVWSLGPSVHFPVFEGGRNAANLKAAESRYEQSVAAYRGAVLNALREVEDALSDLSTLASESEAVNRALVSALDTASLAAERYQKGLSSYLDVVDAQRAVLQAERAEAQLHGQRAVSTILLAKAIGGGWSETSQASPADPTVAPQ